MLSSLVCCITTFVGLCIRTETKARAEGAVACRGSEDSSKPQERAQLSSLASCLGVPCSQVWNGFGRALFPCTERSLTKCAQIAAGRVSTVPCSGRGED